MLAGFIAAMVIGIPLGLLMAVSKTFNGLSFPSFEVLRPIPPLAWVPVSIIFWPTQELSIAFVTFLGAFFTVVINVLGGARAIDRRFLQALQAAQAMGASQWDIFRRIVLPATLPSIVVGSSVGMGITWNVVVAAEMISGGGSSGSGGGLGFFIWNSYVGGSYEQIIVGMISIGIAGFGCSEILRAPRRPVHSLAATALKVHMQTSSQRPARSASRTSASHMAAVRSRRPSCRTARSRSSATG